MSFLVSMPFMGVLLVLLIVVLALATFVESAYDTGTAWAVVYGTHWFEVLLLLVAVNVAGVMVRQRFFRRKKLVVLLFHLAFLMILAGAAITRFISYEGMMHIRENEMSSTMMSDNGFMHVVLESGGERTEDLREVKLTELTPGNYRLRTRIADERVMIKSVDFMSNVTEQYVEGPGGLPYLQLSVVGNRQTTVGLPSGAVKNIMGMDISFNAEHDDATLRFSYGEEGILVRASIPMIAHSMMGGAGAVEYPADSPIPVQRGTLYFAGDLQLALQKFMPSARRELVQAPAGGMGGHLAMVRLEIRYRGMTSELDVPGLARIEGTPVTGSMGDLSYTVTWGARKVTIPFSLFLKDFQVERYPGSNSPSSFASEVVLIDEEMGIRENRRIFMNNVLKHRGYRFYQSSYDNDERGTVLSVNKDWAGTFVTYAGYLILIAGMVLALFVPGTRFALMARRSGRAVKGVVMFLLMAWMALPAFSQEVPPKEVAREFGNLWVQDKGGRFKPMNTLSHEVVRKVIREQRYRNYSADQVMLGMILYPETWQGKPLFGIKHPELHKLVGYKGEKVSFNDLIGDSGEGYLLSELVNQAYAKQVASQTELDREVIKLDDRVNALYLVQSGGMLRIFPDPGSENHRWKSVSEAAPAHGMEAGMDTLSMTFKTYLYALQDGDYISADMLLKGIMARQEAGEELLPSSRQKRLEILYNRIGLFPRLARFYLLFGALMMLFKFLMDFRSRRWVQYFFWVGVIHLAAAFAIHTLALTGRWYISGHAPMSNGYESMIFVSWVTLLAGLIFVKRSGYAMALTAVLAGLSLVVAGMSNMNPEITNPVPVLKSPWLTIHVAVIMAGYGFLGLASIMGLLNVVLFALLKESNRATMMEVIGQVTRVNHMVLIIGLYFMTAGVFLGGVWANESWGRYWGWDPKETWALITVLVYAFVAHMHRIPGLRGTFAFNLASFIGYSSVLMTYFGVNYFLGGIHSYASGSSFKLPWFAYMIMAGLVALSVYAYTRQKGIIVEGVEDREV